MPSYYDDYSDPSAINTGGRASLDWGKTSKPKKPDSPLFTFFAGTELRAALTTYAVVLALGLGLGFGLPAGNQYPSSWNANLVSSVIGWVYFSAWSVSFWPQIFVNFYRKSVVGLSFDYVALNLLGFSCYSAYNVALFYNPEIRAEYEAAHDGNKPGVQVQDVFFSLHAVAVTALLCLQIFIYDRGNQRVSWTCWGIIAVLITSILVVAGCVLGKAGHWFSWLNFLLFVSYVKLLISCLKYIPQVFLNCRRRSTVGWNVYNVMLDFTGGALSVGQLVLDCEVAGNWSQLVGDPVKFGLGNISMFFDIIFFVQHYCLYPSNGEEEEASDAPAAVHMTTDDEYAALIRDTVGDASYAPVPTGKQQQQRQAGGYAAYAGY